MKYYFQIPVFVQAEDEDDDYRRMKALDHHPEILKIVADGWNNFMEAYYLELEDNFNSDIDIDDSYKGIDDTEAFIQDNELIVEVETSHKLSSIKIDHLRNSINGQCSDGWGESFEQVEQHYKEMILYISTWTHTENRTVTYLPNFQRQ